VLEVSVTPAKTTRERVLPDRRGVDRGDLDFETWYLYAYPSIRTAISALAGEDHASEATAEAFARAYQHWARVSRMASPSGWTFRVAHNLVRRRRRRARVEVALWQRSYQRCDEETSPLAFSVDLMRDLTRLGPRMRTAVVLRYMADMAEADIAVAMGITRGGVSALLSKVRGHLQAMLTPQEEGT
jgi:RNA polymerase sigma-70 factor, ECF subfamily